MTAMTSRELGITSPAERAAAAQRRDSDKRVRWVRDKLTSASGTPAFDYELLRRHGLTNEQEGTQLRTFGAGRYLVTYAFEEPPTIEGADVVHHVRGRLRVTVVDK